jgi:pyruvate-formate lyase-activating enzyme
VRGCPEHGRITTLYEEDGEILDYLEQWTAPTKHHDPDRAGNFDPVPVCYTRGLGEMQNQHTCTFLIDLTNSCNLHCPTCFASAAPSDHASAPVSDVLHSLDTRLAREGDSLDVVMLSGGEPTLHPEFTTILDEVLARPVQRVLVNTNGVLIARDDKLLDLLAARRDRVEVYLQFDGFRASSHLALRGADLTKVKVAAVTRLSDAEVFTTLVMTAARGVNEDEIGSVTRFAFDTPFVAGLNIQPVFGSGRGAQPDPLDHITNTGVLRGLEAATNGLARWDDLIALPCSHPHCCSIGYFLRADDDLWHSVVSTIGHEPLKQHLGLVSNRILDHDLTAQIGELSREAFTGVFREGASLTDRVVRDWFDTVRRQCRFSIPSLLRTIGMPKRAQERLRREAGSRIKRLSVKPFMDISTMIEERLLQCCVHVGAIGDAGPQCLPFCAAQAWPALTATKIPLAAAR